MRVGLALALCFAGTALTGVGSAKTPDTELAAPADIKISEQGAGRIFVDARGMALYTFDRDVEPSKSACNGVCANAWPPLLVRDQGAPPADWTVLTREDGSKQWAFRGKPLYLFARDSKAGDTSGDGVNGTWHVAIVPAVLPTMPASVHLQESLL